MTEADQRLMEAIFGKEEAAKMTKDSLPSSSLDRFPIAEQRKLLLAWKHKVIKTIEENTAEVYWYGDGLRVRRLIGSLSSIHGRIG